MSLQRVFEMYPGLDRREIAVTVANALQEVLAPRFNGMVHVLGDPDPFVHTAINLWIRFGPPAKVKPDNCRVSFDMGWAFPSRDDLVEHIAQVVVKSAPMWGGGAP